MIKSIVGVMWLSLALATTACGSNFDGSDTETASEPAGIVNGVDLGASELSAAGLVAIYHPKEPLYPSFHPRPCGGVIVRSEGGLSTVLTARHCVTTDSTIGGQLADGSALRFSPTLTPGPALPDPPPDAVSGWFVVDRFGTLADIALVYVFADWSSIANHRIGLYVGDPHHLLSQSIIAYGYGINVADGNCGSDYSTVGAGTARSGAYFPIVEAYTDPAEYGYTNVSSNGQSIYCGDSGGPDEIVGGQGRVLLGVHSSGASTLIPAYSTAIDIGMQNTLGGLYLRPASVPADSALAEDPSTGNVQIVSAGNPQMTTVSYDPASKLLNMNGRCVSAVSSLWPPSIAHLLECNTADASQLWSVNPNGQIVNPQTGKCLAVSSSGVVLGSCLVTLLGRPFRPSSTLWTFRAQQ